jgi:L-erythro-3,5-diaminohexanoate dehydrogenase
VLDETGVLPQAAGRLDPSPTIGADEVRVRVHRLNLDAASFRQLREQYARDGAAVRAAVARIVAERGKMHNPVTGSGGMLIGTVEAVGPDSPHGLVPGDRIATLVSLTLTPLEITDGLAGWDGTTEQVPCDGHAILFRSSIAAKLPDDLSEQLALAVLDGCGAPALTDRQVRSYEQPTVCVLGAAGKSGSLAAAAARRAGARTVVGVVPNTAEETALLASGLADEVVRADARDPLGVDSWLPDGADVTVVCVDAPGCEGTAIRATRAGGTIIFFSMATSFSSAALTAEGLAADLTMLIGNGYVPGHAEYALELLRNEPGVRTLFEARLDETPDKTKVNA